MKGLNLEITINDVALVCQAGPLGATLYMEYSDVANLALGGSDMTCDSSGNVSHGFKLSEGQFDTAPVPFRLAPCETVYAVIPGTSTATVPVDFLIVDGGVL